MTVKPGDQKSLNGRHILIVDDEPDFAESLRDLLELQGCEVRTTGDPETLPALRTQFEPSVVLLDVRLNNANGIELIDKIRTIWPQARIIIVTGYASKETAVEALAMGAANYLEKPIHTEELTATIGRALWAYDADKEVRDSREKLEESLRAAQTANLAKSAFLAHMSHELRTPLNAIIALSDIVQNEGFGKISPKIYLDYIRDIHGAGHHVLSIINDVLDYAQVDLGTKALDEELMAVDQVVSEACRMVRVAAKDRDVQVSESTPRTGLWLKADRRMLKQMIVNLLDNGVKFSNPNGQVGIGARLDSTDEIVIEVTDTGIGIDAEKLPEVTEPFSIAEPIYTRRHGGVGLGLSITKQLVERHGGKLELQSTKGVGTTATLRFPSHRKCEREPLSNVS